MVGFKFWNAFLIIGILILSLGVGRPIAAQAEQTPPTPADLGLRLRMQEFPHYHITSSSGEVQSPSAPDAPETLADWSKIVFFSYRDNNWEIYRALGDGSAQSRLTNHNSADVEPRLNRGCTQIVFSSRRDGDYEIFSMNTDGSGLAQLTSNATYSDESPVWSPDGTRIAFQTDRDGQSEIYSMNADGTGLMRVTSNAAYDGQPNWSPDGRSLAFTSNRSGNYRIWVMNLDGSSPVQLSNQSYSSDPTWSPDGKRIAYSADGDDNGWLELWTMNADGSNQSIFRFPDSGNTDYYMRSWSPDGAWIAYTRVSWVYSNNQWYWTTAYLDALSFPGSFAKRLSTTGDDWYPDWQTCDNLPPTSSLDPLPETSPGRFSLDLSGSDAGLAGLKDYDIQVRVGLSGLWTDWRYGAGSHSNLYTGVREQVLYFRSRARDWAYNLEAWPADYETFTTVENQPPISEVRELSAFTPNGAAISWHGWDQGESLVEKYEIQYRPASSPTWQDWQLNTGSASAPFTGTPGERYFFRSKAVDTAQNEEDWPQGEGDASTTLYNWGLRGRVLDPTGLPVGGVTITTTPAAFAQYPLDRPGEYGVYVAESAGSYSIDWGKPGYGNLPLTAHTGGQGGVLDVVLPPVDNLVSDGNFESGNLSAWMTGGTTPPVISTQKHTGTFAALLGNKPQPSFTPPVNITGSSQRCVSPITKLDASGILHLMCGSQITMNQLFYAQRGLDGAWTPLELASTNHVAMQSDYFYYKFDVDQNGGVHVIWSTYRDDNYDVFYRYRSPGGTWAGVINLSHNPQDSSDENLGQVTIAVDPYGQVHAAWDFRKPGIGDIFYSWRDTNGVWSVPANLSNDPNSSGNPKLLANSFGRVHLLWEDNRSGVFNVYYRERSAAGFWSDPVNLSVTTLLVMDYNLKVNETGDLHVAWMEFQNFNPYAIRYRHRDASGRWSNIEEVTNLASFPYLCGLLADKDGRARVLWRQSHNSWLSTRKPNGEWDIPTQIYTSSGSYCGNLFTDSSGKLHLLINELPRLRYRQLGLDGVWSNVVTMSTTMQESRELQLEASGIVHSLWVSYEGGQWRLNYSHLDVPGTDANSSLSQQMTLPVDMDSPILSFLYQFSGGSEFSVTIDNGSGPSEVFSTNEYTQNWTHNWVDLSPWIGQTVTVSFEVQQAAGVPYAWVLMDDVSIGAAHPDVWLRKTALPPSALPGESVVFTLAYGNSGLAPAASVRITDTLPAELAFVSASLPPVTITPALVWNLPGVPASSGPYTIQVTTTLTSSVPMWSNLMNTASISLVGGELEGWNNLVQERVFAGKLIYIPLAQRR